MASMQQVIIAGHLGHDPEIKITSGGVPMCTFSVAVDRPYGEHETDWFSVRTWRGVAEACKKCLCKGSFVVVAGRMESYVKDLVLDGGEVRRIKRWTLVADEVTFGPKGSGVSTATACPAEPEPVPPPESSTTNRPEKG